MTGPIMEILMQWMEVMLVFSGMAGVFLSLMLLCMPERMRSWNHRFDRYYDTEGPLRFLDVSLPTDIWVYRHTMASGSILLLGSLVFMFFLFARLDAGRFSSVFMGTPVLSPFQEVIYRTVVIFLKLASFAGAIVGVFLLFAAEKVRQIDTRMTKVLPTDPIIHRLNQSYRIVDRIFLSHPRLFGATGLAASASLTWVTAHYLLQG
ncbi:MAG: hypothetical protein LJE65_00050 [Desulfobacteraceae bacterium]|nr:hypothetical protein [Desulfobacteraceae bacterium]